LTLYQIKQLAYLTADKLSQWEHLDFWIAKALDTALPYLGKIQITETFATSGHAPNSYHYQGKAIDFKPLSLPLWHCYLILKAIGVRGIGIDPGQKLIHIDARMIPYYFLEVAGIDAGALQDAKNSATVSSIPGYGTAPTIMQTAGNALSQAAKAVYSESTPAKIITASTIGGALLLALLIIK
jgi:hypothetical protein